MISGLKPGSRKIVCLMAKPFIALKVPPLAISLLGLLFALAFAFFALQGNFLAGFACVLLAAIADAIDGTVARLQKKQSPFGNYIDAVIDKAVDFVIIGSLVFLFPFASALALGLSFLASYAKPRAGLVIVTDNRDWPGIGERGDKIVVLLAGLLLAGFFPVLYSFHVLEAALFLVAAVSFIGVVQRLSFAKKLIGEAERSGTLLPYLKREK